MSQLFSAFLAALLLWSAAAYTTPRPPSIASQQTDSSAPLSLAAENPGTHIHSDLKRSSATDPCAVVDPLNKPYFGDLHVHTRYSLDANTQGTRTTPDQAYRFARGEPLGIQPWDESGAAGRSLQLQRPLDFAMLSDHAELLGEVQICTTPGEPGYDAWQCRLYRGFPRLAFYAFNAYAAYTSDRMGFCGDKDTGLCAQALLKPWAETQAAAAAHNNPDGDCSFTTFVGYEWTGMSPAGGNWHRNVLFANDQVPARPFSFVDGPEPELLWGALDSECDAAPEGCRSLTIPHNSNVSRGEMFMSTDANQEPITEQYARLRQRYEPLVEIMQHKGSSECYFEAGVSADELCAFEQLPFDALGGRGGVPKANAGWLRDTLTEGLVLQQTLGVNPYRYGFIASTDTHLGAPGAADESQFLGHGGDGVPARDAVPPGLPDKLSYNPGGLAVVWAPRNTRTDLYAAMLRRETYATSGPRIVTRFFGGWELPQNLCESTQLVQTGYEKGVPMGAELPARVAATAPQFIVTAQSDPGTDTEAGMPLQRIQVIKGWLDQQGQAQEQVFDVAGKRDNGAGVDTSSCETWGSDTGSLCAVWSDPEFEPDQDAWYYTRVLENPSCRWSQRICVANGVDCELPETITDGLQGCCAANHRPVIQERAWSSPIWYRADKTL